jgi:hypothetical protein
MLNIVVNENDYAQYMVILTAGYIAKGMNATDAADCAQDTLENILGVTEQERR